MESMSEDMFVCGRVCVRRCVEVCQLINTVGGELISK